MTEEQKQKILNLIDKNKVGIIATNSFGRESPQSAAIVLSVTPELSIIFGSLKDRRKNKNIRENKKVSMVIGFDIDEMKTIQLEGDAYILTDEKRIEEIKNLHYIKNPQSLKYKDNPLREYIEIIPFWIRYSDLGKDSPEVFEIDFDK